MKKKLQKWLEPRWWVALMGAVVIGGGMTYLVELDRFDQPEAYVLYLLMTAGLVEVVIYLTALIRQVLGYLMDSNKYLRRYRDEPLVQYRVSLMGSLAMNVTYVLFNFATGAMFSSLWSVGFAAYYLILVILRADIARNELKKQRSEKQERRLYRRTGVTLLLINLFLLIVVTVVASGGVSIVYGQIVAIAVACWTFYLMVHSVMVLVRYRRYQNPLMSAAKVVDVVAAMVSMLSLEVIMLSTFGGETETKNILVMVAGGVIGAVTTVVAIKMMMLREK